MRISFFYTYGGKHPVAGDIYYTRFNAEGEHKKRYENNLLSALSFFARQIDDCDRVIAELELVENGLVEKIEIHGEDVLVTATQNEIEVDVLIDDEGGENFNGRFKFSEFKKILLKWKEFLGLPESLNSRVDFNI